MLLSFMTFKEKFGFISLNTNLMFPIFLLNFINSFQIFLHNIINLKNNNDTEYIDKSLYKLLR